MTVETVPTSGSIATLIILPLLIAGLLVGAYLLRRWSRRCEDQFDRNGGIWLTVACLVSAVIAAVGLWWGMYPWKAEYHQWRPVSGTVQTIDSRMTTTEGGGMEDKFVVTFEGNAQQYGVLDTRAAGVKPGDWLTITCVKRWQYSGAHGFDCHFVDLTRRPSTPVDGG